MKMDRDEWRARSQVERLTDKISCVKSPMKRHRYHMRIKLAKAKLLALKLSQAANGR